MSKIDKLELLADKIEDTILFRGISKSRLAELCGVNASEVTRWLTGRHNFTVKVLLKIEEALDIQLLDVWLDD